MGKPKHVEVTERTVEKSYRIARHANEGLDELIIRPFGDCAIAIAEVDDDGDERDCVYVHDDRLDALVWALQQAKQDRGEA